MKKIWVKSIILIIFSNILFLPQIVIANDHSKIVLIYCYSRDCPACHKTTPEIHRIKNEFNIQIIGNCYEGVENTLFDLNISDKKFFEGKAQIHLPAIFILNPQTAEWQHLNTGYSDYLNIKKLIDQCEL